jgi:hypothetical protein
MIPINHEFIRYNDKLYDIKRKYPEARVRADKIDDLRQALSCDITLKKEGNLYFCVQIQEAEIVQ